MWHVENFCSAPKSQSVCVYLLYVCSMLVPMSMCIWRGPGAGVAAGELWRCSDHVTQLTDLLTNGRQLNAHQCLAAPPGSCTALQRQPPCPVLKVWLAATHAAGRPWVTLLAHTSPPAAAPGNCSRNCTNSTLPMLGGSEGAPASGFMGQDITQPVHACRRCKAGQS
jgi:hypothetical protein